MPIELVLTGLADRVLRLILSWPGNADIGAEPLVCAKADPVARQRVQTRRFMTLI